MRNLFPQNNSTDILGKDSDIVKKEDLLPVVEQLQNTIQQLNILSDNLQQYKDDNEDIITTEQLNAVNAAIQSLEATESNLTSAEVDNLTVSSLATLTTLTAQIATITSSLSVPEIQTNEISAMDLSASEGYFMSLKADTAEIDNWNISNFSIENLTVSQSFETTNLDATTGNIGTLSAGIATIEGNTSVGGDLEVTGDISGASVDTDEVTTENVTWKGEVALSNQADFFLEIPHFENGQYYLQLLQNDEPYITVEIYNSVDNYLVRWSQRDYNLLENIYISGTGPASKIYLEIENDDALSMTLKYATTSVTPNVQGPLSYNELPITPDNTYEVRYKDGSKFFKNVDLAQTGSTVGVFRTLASDVYSSATEDVSYDTTEDVEAIIYKPDQSLNEADDVKFHEVDTTFLNVRDFSTRNFVATEMQTLSTIDLTKYDDGAIVVVRIGSTAASNQPSAAYVKQTENGTPVLYKIMTGKNLAASGSNSNKPLIWSVADQAITEATNIEITGTIDVGGNATFGGTVGITGDTTIGGDTTITGDISANDATFAGDADITGDVTIGGDTTITGDISADNASVSSLDVGGTTTIHGDLYVDGVTHTTTEEQINTTGDTLTLRQNNNTTLGATYAGIIINKYNGTSDLALVSNSDGTLRVGTGVGSTTSYTDIYWDDDTSKWYSDSALTTEVTPTGTLTSWVSLEIIGDVKHYSGAVFTQINFTGLVPLLARDEDTNLDDQSLLKWDATTKTAKTIVIPTDDNALLKWDNTNKVFVAIPNPTSDGQVLANKVVSNENTYDWVDQAKNYVFATMADYTAAASTVPDGSLVIIENEKDYLIGENQ